MVEIALTSIADRSAAYFVAGPGMTALTSGDAKLVVVPPFRARATLGYNVGYLKFTTAPTWNPF
jgi:hypothetical protein